MGYLFWGLTHRSRAKRGTPRIKEHLEIKGADKAVLADFMILQSVWRQQERSTFKRMPSSREERQAWKHLIQYLTRLPPPED
jgi:SOS response regulatory protein OraA/RecX